MCVSPTVVKVLWVEGGLNGYNTLKDDKLELQREIQIGNHLSNFHGRLLPSGNRRAHKHSAKHDIFSCLLARWAVDCQRDRGDNSAAPHFLVQVLIALTLGQGPVGLH